jgi:hypothetical protein
MIFPCAMGLWSWWLLPSETIPMAHEVMGYAVSPRHHHDSARIT